MNVLPVHRNKTGGKIKIMLFDPDNEHKLTANLRCGSSKMICHQKKNISIITWTNKNFPFIFIVWQLIFTFHGYAL